MIADRQGLQPRYKVVRFAASTGSQNEFCAIGPGYLLLIDRENPLSSLPGRR